MQKTAVLVVLVVLALATTSCNISSVTIGDIETGPTLTEEIKVPIPEGGGTSSVQIGMGGGDLFISVGNVDNLVDGTVAYNVEDLKPSVQTSGSRVVIEQGDLEGKRIPIGDWSDVENRWDLTLGTAPMELTANAGAARAELTMLGDLNASAMEFNGGAGDFTLDFAGDLKQDMQVTVTAGAAEVAIIVPEGRAAELTFEGALTDIDAQGAWQKTGSAYILEGDGPQITFKIRMGVGSLDLRNR